MTDTLRRVAKLASGLDSARPSDRRLAEQIVAEAEIGFSTDEDAVTASLGATPASGGRTVRFTQNKNQIRWLCTCTGDESPWCKHAIAAIIAAGGHLVDAEGIEPPTASL